MIGVVNKNRMDRAQKADYEIADTNSLFATGVNMIPAPTSVQGPRLLYGNKFFEQALPLENREAPLVRNMQNESGRSWDWVIGDQLGAIRSQDDEEGAVVEKVEPSRILLRMPDGTKRERELYDSFPGNRKTLMTSYANVKPGDMVTKGQTLASSNFTDPEGRMALGLNARVAVVPYKGYSMDDAIVISQSLANRLSSMHAETVDRDHDEDLTLGKSHFISLFPDAYKQDQLDHLDDDGLPVKGQIIQPGDPLVLQTRPRQFNSNSGDVARLSRNKRFVRKDASLKWEGDHPAEILGVSKTKDGGNRILLSYKAPVASGDKLVYRPGAKSTVSLILPDEKMPRTEDGRPVEMLMNQLSLPSRENFETYLELMLGKIARKTGKPYVLPQFLPPGQKWNEFAKAELEKHGLKDAERLYDPEEDIFLDNEVAVGDAFVMKLHHQAANKMTARGQKGYTLDQQPMRGQGQSAQRVSGLEMTALHSSGARGIQQEAILLKGEKRDDYWRSLRANRQPAKLDKPFVWDKFLALLQGSGIDPADRGKGVLRLSPMTSKKLAELDPLEIQNEGIVDLNTWEPKKGGLFDPQLTLDGRWGYIKLKEPVVNPAYEDTVRVLLGLTKDEYEKLLDPP
jgi:DNA-directed RNA polymerase subunit beta